MDFPLSEQERHIFEIISQEGGDPWIVGGATRNVIMGRANNADIDVEVFGMTWTDLGRALRMANVIPSVINARVAPICRVKLDNGSWIDFSIGSTLETNLTVAALERDLSMNAVYYSPVLDNIFDPMNGIRDIERGILRHCNDKTFVNDPLRVLRIMRFAGELGFRINLNTAALCRILFERYDTVEKDRIWMEWHRWAICSPYVERSMTALMLTGWLEHYPELYNMVGVKQDKFWHPEIYVHTHAFLAAQKADEIARREGLDHRNHAILKFAAILHDIGKPPTTTTNEQGRIVSPGHAEMGAQMAQTFLRSIHAPAWVHEQVIPLIATHMRASGADPVTRRRVTRLARDLQPAPLWMWSLLVECDHAARPPLKIDNPALPFMEMAKHLDVTDRPERSIITGKLLLALGLSEGPQIGAIIEQADAAQLDGAFEDQDTAILWLQAEGLLGDNYV